MTTTCQSLKCRGKAVRAVWNCTDCSKQMCGDCKESHDIPAANAKHSVNPTVSTETPEKTYVCDICPEKREAVKRCTAKECKDKCYLCETCLENYHNVWISTGHNLVDPDLKITGGKGKLKEMDSPKDPNGFNLNFLTHVRGRSGRVFQKTGMLTMLVAAKPHKPKGKNGKPSYLIETSGHRDLVQAFKSGDLRYGHDLPFSPDIPTNWVPKDLHPLIPGGNQSLGATPSPRGAARRAASPNTSPSKVDPFDFNSENDTPTRASESAASSGGHRLQMNRKPLNRNPQTGRGLTDTGNPEKGGTSTNQRISAVREKSAASKTVAISDDESDEELNAASAASLEFSEGPSAANPRVPAGASGALKRGSGAPNKRPAVSAKKPKKLTKDDFCAFCLGMYGDRKVDWIGCSICLKWQHVDCSGTLDGDYFYCVECEPEGEADDDVENSG